MSARLHSARARLTLQSLLVSAPVTAGLLVALYLGALSAFEAQDRTVVQEEAESAMVLLAARPDQPPAAALAPLLNEAEGKTERHLWLGRDKASVLVRPAGFALQPLPPGISWNTLPVNEIAVGEGRGLHGERLRVASVRLPPGAGEATRLQLARLLKPPVHQRQRWRAGLAAVFALLTALSALITWVMTGRTLRPVREMISAAEGYEPGRGRLPISAAGGDEFSALASSLNRILARLEDASLQSRRFSADAAHELRTPLAGLRTMMEVAQAHPRGADESAALFRDALGELARIERRLDALLHLARIEAGEKPAAGPSLEIAPWCEENLRAWREACEKKGVGWRLTGDGTTRLPEEWLRILLDNLIGNALRHTPAGGEIRVTLEKSGHTLTVRVADTGPGIAAAQHAAIWERFVRGNAAAGAGSGLGLSLCDAICRQLGGERELRSGSGEGAEFVFRFPEPVAMNEN